MSGLRGGPAVPHGDTSVGRDYDAVMSDPVSPPRHTFLAPIPPGVEPAIPALGQESVWDYPRPPRVERVPERIRVIVEGVTIAESVRALRVLETAGAPVYYVPPEDVRIMRCCPFLISKGPYSGCSCFDFGASTTNWPLKLARVPNFRSAI